MPPRKTSHSTPRPVWSARSDRPVPAWLAPIAKAELPEGLDADAAAFQSTRDALVVDLDRLWSRSMRRWRDDTRLMDDLGATFGRVAEAYARDGEMGEPGWDRVARARGAAWAAAAAAFARALDG